MLLSRCSPGEVEVAEAALVAGEIVVKGRLDVQRLRAGEETSRASGGASHLVQAKGGVDEAAAFPAPRGRARGCVSAGFQRALASGSPGAVRSRACPAASSGSESSSASRRRTCPVRCSLARRAGACAWPSAISPASSPALHPPRKELQRRLDGAGLDISTPALSASGSGTPSRRLSGSRGSASRRRSRAPARKGNRGAEAGGVFVDVERAVEMRDAQALELQLGDRSRSPGRSKRRASRDTSGGRCRP